MRKDHVQQAEMETLKRQMQAEKEHLEHTIIQLKSARTIDEDKRLHRNTYRGTCLYLSRFLQATLYSCWSNAYKTEKNFGERVRGRSSAKSGLAAEAQHISSTNSSSKNNSSSGDRFNS